MVHAQQEQINVNLIYIFPYLVVSILHKYIRSSLYFISSDSLLLSVFISLVFILFSLFTSLPVLPNTPEPIPVVKLRKENI